MFTLILLLGGSILFGLGLVLVLGRSGVAKTKTEEQTNHTARKDQRKSYQVAPVAQVRSSLLQVHLIDQIWLI